MTYRRLYLHLLLFSTLAMAGLWWVSFRSYSRFSWSSRSGGPVVQGTFISATVSLQVTSVNTRSTIKLTDLEVITDPGVIEFVSVHYHPTGSFRWSSQQDESLLGVPYHVWQLKFPIWFPWLLFATGGYGLMRFLEKRAGAVEEKKLASRDAVKIAG